MSLSPAHLHLFLNHIPILGTFALVVLLGLGLFRRSDELLKLGLSATVILALFTFAVRQSGHSAEHQLEHESWFDEDRVEEHEELADAGFYIMLAVSAVALIARWRARGERPASRAWSGMVVAGLLAAGGVFGAAALEGGQIRHEELRSTAAP